MSYFSLRKGILVRRVHLGVSDRGRQLGLRPRNDSVSHVEGVLGVMSHRPFHSVVLPCCGPLCSSKRRWPPISCSQVSVSSQGFSPLQAVKPWKAGAFGNSANESSAWMQGANEWWMMDTPWSVKDLCSLGGGFISLAERVGSSSNGAEATSSSSLAQGLLWRQDTCPPPHTHTQPSFQRLLHTASWPSPPPS